MDWKKWKILIFLFLMTVLCGCSSEHTASEGRKTLVLATFMEDGEDGELSRAAVRFHKNHPDIQIEIRNYAGDSSDIRDAVNKVKMEIIAGKGPDLIDFGRYYSEGDAANGMMVNLYDFIEKDETFREEDYFYNVITSFATGERLYVMIPDYSISSFATAMPEWKDKKVWGMEDLMECYTRKPEGTILFPGETKLAVFGVLCTGSMANYINWEEGTCSFGSKDFQNLLVFANQFPLKLNLAEDVSVKELFAEGKAILFPTAIRDVFETGKVRILLSEDAEFIGYPMKNGSGNIVGSNRTVIGIGRNCFDKETAWEFIKSLLQEEYQDKIKDGLPVRRSSLDKTLKQAMTPEYMENGEKREKRAKAQLIIDGEEPIPVYEITDSDAMKLISVIENVEYNSTVDRELYQLILEEAEIFFQGDRTAEQSADMIQRRASVYISEKK